MALSLRRLAGFARHAGKGFIADHCLVGASALSYTMLLSFLPMTVIVLVIFSNFPIFGGARDHFIVVLLRIFAPDVGEEAARWFEYVATNATKTTAVGVLAFVFTSIMLLATIEDQLNVIWGVTTQRTWVQRVIVYWLILTLGPLLLGVGMSLSGDFDAYASTTGTPGLGAGQAIQTWFADATRFVPFVLEAISFTLLFRLIPNCPVRWRDAAMGALIAAALIEALKLAFALYVSRLSSYSVIYGALAGIPIFLLWMYIFWVVVLFGAEIAAAPAQVRIGKSGAQASPNARKAGLALTLVAELAENRQHGGSLSTQELAASIGTEPVTVGNRLVRLQESGLVAATTDGGWVLARSLASTTLFDVYHALNLPRGVNGQEDANER